MHLRMAGILAGDMDPTALLEAAGAQCTILDLSELRLVGLPATEAWANLVDRLSEKTEQIVLVQCSRPVVTELNLSVELAAKCSVCNNLSRFGNSIQFV